MRKDKGDRLMAIVNVGASGNLFANFETRRKPDDVLQVRVFT